MTLFDKKATRDAILQLHGECTRALVSKMRSADRSRASGDVECCICVLRAINELLSGLALASGVDPIFALRTVFTLAAIAALCLEMLTACSDLLVAVAERAVRKKLQSGEMKLMLTAIKFPWQFASHCLICTARSNELVFSLPGKPGLVNQMDQKIIRRLELSSFVDHNACALVLALESLDNTQATAMAGPGPSGSGATNMHLRQQLLDSLSTMYRFLGGIACGTETALQRSTNEAATTTLVDIRKIMSGPCLQYALSASIVSALAWADGGTLYGMTTPLLLDQDMLPVLAEMWFSLWEHSPPIKLLLYSPCAMRRVCLRMLNVARRSMAFKSTEQQRVAPRGQQQPQEQQQLLPDQTSPPPLPHPLPIKISLGLAVAALRGYALICPYLLVQSLRPGGGSWLGLGSFADSPAAAGVAAVYWSEAVCSLNTLLGCVSTSSKSSYMQPDLGDMLAPLEVAVADWAGRLGAWNLVLVSHQIAAACMLHP